jgi:hypothetical protein
MAVQLEIDSPAENIDYIKIISKKELNHEVLSLIPRGMKVQGHGENGVPIVFEDINQFPDRMRLSRVKNKIDKESEIFRDIGEIFLDAGSVVSFAFGEKSLRVSFIDNSYISIYGQDLELESMIRDASKK